MKKIIRLGALALISLFAMTACDPQDSSDYALGDMPTPEQLDFSITPTTAKVNVVTLENTSAIAGVATWDFGNGTKTKGTSVTAEFPFKGAYTVTMTLYTPGGSATITKIVTIANDDMSLLNTPMYNALTGGAANLAGKTWVFDQYYAGHFSLGPVGDATPSWWSCGAEEKTESCLYSQEFTFTQVGVKLVWTNNGSVYTNEKGRADLATKGHATSVVPGAGDFDVAYVPNATYTFALNETAKTITLSDGAFFGHYTGTSTFDIVTLTDDVMYVKCNSTVESGNSWWYRLIPKEKNIKPVIIIPLKATPLSEDFESLATMKVKFGYEDMGTSLDSCYSNPAPVGINKSKKVFLYEKTSAFYSNISFSAKTYKFDLTEQNQITLKVYIPSYNDYVGTYDVAGSWISNNKLLKQVAVKLQNSGMGGNAWQTQVEIVKSDLPTDRWVDLTFDFSSASARQDFDRIVIQFGAEGHAAPGIFFFDDFAFSK